MLGKIRHAFTADLLHHLLQLSFQHGDGVVSAPASQRSNSIHEGAAHEGEFRAARQRARDIGPGAQAAVNHHGGAIAEFLSQRRHRLNR